MIWGNFICVYNIVFHCDFVVIIENMIVVSTVGGFKLLCNTSSPPWHDDCKTHCIVSSPELKV